MFDAIKRGFAAVIAKAKALALAGAVGVASAASMVPSDAHALAGGLTAAQTNVLSYVALTIAFIVAVGGAVLGLIMVARAIKWARKAG